MEGSWGLRRVIPTIADISSVDLSVESYYSNVQIREKMLLFRQIMEMENPKVATTQTNLSDLDYEDMDDP